MKHAKIFLLIFLFLTSCVPPTQSPTQTPTITFTPAPTATQTPSPTPTMVPTPTQVGGGSGRLIFEYLKAGFKEKFPDLKGEQNIFTSNSDGTDLVPIINGLKGYNRIENISSNGRQVLVSSSSSPNATTSDLYLVDLEPGGSEPFELARGQTKYSVADWLDDSHIVYIGKGTEGHGIYVVNIDGTNPKKISAPGETPVRILLVDKTRVYWASDVKKQFKSDGFLYFNGTFSALWWTNIDGSAQGKLESNGSQIIVDTWQYGHYAFSPDGKSIAWIPVEWEPGCDLGSGHWSPWIRDGVYTKYAGQSGPGVFDKNRSDYGKVVDTAFIEALVRKCDLLHVASLSDMDNPTKIALLPPFDPATDDFMYHKDYQLIWFPDGSKILAYDNGRAAWHAGGVYDYYKLGLYEITLRDIDLHLTQLSGVPFPHGTESAFGSSVPFHILDFSPHGRRISPDGSQLLVEISNKGWPFINILNLKSMTYSQEFGSNITPDSETRRIGSIYWLP